MDQKDIDIQDVILMAKAFVCCPRCGSQSIENHLCNGCKQRFNEPDDAYWFYEYLKRLVMEE